MDRSSSRKDLRSERISNSPYARPEKQAKRRDNDTLKSFPSLSSLVSFVSAPFRRTPALPTHRVQDEPSHDVIDVDQKSVSGSEDEWNGEPPSVMRNQDVFSLAAAAGREGRDFDARAGAWRARGEQEGGRRDTARRGLPASKSTWNPELPVVNGIHASPSMPAVKAERAPPAPSLPARTPTSASYFRPVPATPSALPTSASSVALSAFLDAKAGSPMTSEDLRVLDSLTQSIKAESGAPASTSTSRMGGWSAGTYNTPRASASATPVKTSTPAPMFSLGTAPPLSSTPRKVAYLGPGMSPRRLLPKQRSGLKPLFTFDLEAEDSTGPKKRRVDEPIDERSSASAAAVSPAATATVAASPARPPALQGKASFPSSSTPARPSPLSQSTPAPATPREDIATRAKKRAADIMREVIEAELGPASSQTAAPILVNPYEDIAPKASPSPTPVKATPRKSLRASIRGSNTPTRGAAVKLDQLKTSRKLTTLELVSGYVPPPLPPLPAATPSKAFNTSSKAVRVETPDRERDEMDVDALVDGSPAPPTPQHEPPPLRATPAPTKSAFKIPSPEVFKPLAAPSLSASTSTPVFRPQPAPVHEPTTTFAFDSIISASKAAPSKFTPTPVAPLQMDEDAPYVPATTPRRERDAVEPSAMFLSAKDSALATPRPALPFYTFSLPATSSGPSTASREAALKASVQVFAFDLAVPPISADAPPTVKPLFSSQAASAPAQQWTCNLCMLQNPDSAKEKCTICEAPRPSHGAAPAPSALPKTPAIDGQWTCDTCMLKNPDSVKDKCTICEAPRPKSTLPAPTPASAVPFSMPGFKPVGTQAGEWKCAVCDCTSPDSAVKCVVCETPR